MENHEIDPKVQRILDSNSKLQHHYESLLEKKQIADNALNEFITRVANDNVDSLEVQPSSIMEYTAAMDFVRNRTLKNPAKLEEIKKYITQQQDLEKCWEHTHHRLINDPNTDDGTLKAFYNDCMRQLEEFSKKCHVRFHQMEIPLFCIDKENYYKGLSKDRRNLIEFLQEQVMNK